jgi:integrase
MTRTPEMTFRKPIRCARTGLWLARYNTPAGTVRQAGRFKRKSDAAAAIEAATRRAWGAALETRSELTVREFFEGWAERFPRPARTQLTNLYRVRRYILPYLPEGGHFAFAHLRRPMLREVQRELLDQGLAKRTIDHAFSALSTMLEDAIEDEQADANPARGFRVKVNDPRLRPRRSPRPRRAVPPDEIAAFAAQLPERHLALCLTPLFTGTRTQDLFAMRRSEIDRELELIYLHETADRYGRVMPGMKTTHHIEEKERRGRYTLFPRPLIALTDELPAHLSGWLYPTRTGRVWQQRNFYRDVWEPARSASGTDFTIYDLRHTFSSRLQAAGIPLPEISAWMGHSLRAGGAPVNTTSLIYTHATGEHRRRALDVLHALFEEIERLRRAG